MRRIVVLSVLIGIGTLSIAVAAQRGPATSGRGAAPALIQVEKIAETLFVLRGHGGNSAAFITAEGVVLVDTGFPQYSQVLLAAIGKLTNKPITIVINTHLHGDHVGGQLEFPQNIRYVAHLNTKLAMEKSSPLQEPRNTGKLPTSTYTKRLSLLSGRDRVELYYFGPAHTDGDAWVAFPSVGAVHAGDVFRGKVIPVVDTTFGGSGVKYPETLRKAVAGLKNVRTVITGHGETTMTWNDLREYADFNRDVVAWARTQKAARRTPEQAAADYRLAERFKAYSAATMFGGMPGYVKALYTELGD